jgi:hypothetical protein
MSVLALLYSSIEAHLVWRLLSAYLLLDNVRYEAITRNDKRTHGRNNELEKLHFNPLLFHLLLARARFG